MQLFLCRRDYIANGVLLCGKHGAAACEFRGRSRTGFNVRADFFTVRKQDICFLLCLGGSVRKRLFCFFFRSGNLFRRFRFGIRKDLFYNSVQSCCHGSILFLSFLDFW